MTLSLANFAQALASTLYLRNGNCTLFSGRNGSKHAFQKGGIERIIPDAEGWLHSNGIYDCYNIRGLDRALMYIKS